MKRSQRALCAAPGTRLVLSDATCYHYIFITYLLVGGKDLGIHLRKEALKIKKITEQMLPARGSLVCQEGSRAMGLGSTDLLCGLGQVT